MCIVRGNEGVGGECIGIRVGWLGIIFTFALLDIQMSVPNNLVTEK